MNLTELKARAYDILAQIEYLQRELQSINEQIGNYGEQENK